MKEELQNKLVEILTAIQVGVAKTSDFTLEHLPDIAQQYLLYGKVWSAIAVQVMLATTVILAWSTLKFGYLNKKTDDYGDWTEGRIVVTIIGTVAFLIAASIFLVALHELVLIQFAPKVWLIKEVTELLK